MEGDLGQWAWRRQNPARRRIDRAIQKEFDQAVDPPL
jgi:hypothetical protein